jgi:copper chaperone CopZ
MSRALSLLVAAFSVVTPAASAETARTTLKIEGMTCGGCVPAVKLQLKKTEGVLAYEVSFEKGEAQVSFDPAKTTPGKIAESVTWTGYTASVKSSEGASAAGGSPATAQSKAVSANAEGAPERVTLFQVPLMCPAVKGLGCGGKARPFMAELEKQPEVAEAWLNHPGTLLGVVWKGPQKHAHATSVVATLFTTKGLTVTAVEGPALNDALQDFAARAKWYRGQDVNKLSEQEGLVFTERMAKRVESRTRLSPASSTALRADLRKFCIEWLVGQGGRDTKVLLGLAATYMDSAQLKVYDEALKEGFQALPGESLS